MADPMDNALASNLRNALASNPSPSSIHALGDVKVILKDFVIRCSPKHSTYPAFDTLRVVVVGMTDGGSMSMRKLSPREWKSDRIIKLRRLGMGIVLFVVHANAARELGRIVLMEDEVRRLRKVQDSSHGYDITVERRFELSELKCSSLYMAFTIVGMSRDDLVDSDLRSAGPDLQRGIRLTPQGRADLIAKLGNLGMSSLSRFGLAGDLSSIENAISNFQSAIELTPHGSAVMPELLDKLGIAFQFRVDYTSNFLEDIEKAVSCGQLATKLTSHGDVAMPIRLHNLGKALASRFNCTGDLADIENAISHYQRSIKLAPPEGDLLANHTNSLGNAFLFRFYRSDDLADINNAISNFHRAVEISTPLGRSTILQDYHNNLGASFSARFLRTGDLADIDSAISNIKCAIELAPSLHPMMYRPFCNLGVSFAARFNRTDDLTDIENAISYYQLAIKHIPHSHTDLPRVLINLGDAFQSRFGRTGEPDDTKNAISNQQYALELIGPQDPLLRSSALNTLANSFFHRFTHTHKLTDINNAISNGQRAIELTPPDHPYLPGRLNNLGMALEHRFRLTDDLADIKTALSNIQLAVELTPHGHVNRPGLLSNLGKSSLCYSKSTGNIADIGTAISTLQHAIELTPHGHAGLPPRLNDLGEAWYECFQRTEEPEHLDEAISAYRSSANHPTGAPTLRLLASTMWGQLSYRVNHRVVDTLEAFRTGIELLSQIAGLEQTVHRRYTILVDTPHLTPAATGAAIDAGHIDTALEWLEQGRCLVWNQVNQLRTPVEDLRTHNPSLADRFLHVANQLEVFGSRQAKSTLMTCSPETMMQPEMIAIQDEHKRHVELAKEWTQLLEEIRAEPNFSRFLRPPSASSLLVDLPRDGCVVIFNIHKAGCHALALLPGADLPLHIPLQSFSHKQATKLRDDLLTYLKREEGREAGRPPRMKNGKLHMVLRDLWEGVAKPVLDALAFNSPSQKSDRPRLWWCPTGPLALLPIHAAGIYTAGKTRAGPCVADYVVSSYTPTIGALQDRIKSVRPVVEETPTRVLLISQPSTPGQKPIPATETETRGLKELMVKEHLEPLLLNDDAATITRVTEEMKTHSWIHFACHAVQGKKPLKSGIHLHDGRLELLEMMKHHIVHADHVFLSACQTGTGDVKLSDEVIHIAAGMLSIGYRGVVGTMWSISDEEGPKIAEGFYQYILNAAPGRETGQKRLDSCWAARALDDSIQKTRDRLEDTQEALMIWVPYVHFGI